jgi:hypothetical protein
LCDSADKAEFIGFSVHIGVTAAPAVLERTKKNVLNEVCTSLSAMWTDGGESGGMERKWLR